MPKVEATISWGNILNFGGLLLAVGIAWGVMKNGSETTQKRVDSLVTLIDEERGVRANAVFNEQQQRREVTRELELRLRLLETTTARVEARTEEKFNTILLRLLSKVSLRETINDEQDGEGYSYCAAL